MPNHNLAALPEPERQAILDDKRRWYEAHRLRKTRDRMGITEHLNALPEREREDMRRRLNTIKQNRRANRR